MLQHFLFTLTTFFLLCTSLFAQPSLVSDYHTGEEDGINIYRAEAESIGSRLVLNIENEDTGLEIGVIENGNLSILKDIMEGTASSVPSDYIKMSDKIVFVASDTDLGHSIWETDGTPEGTKAIFSPAPGVISGGRPSGLILAKSGILYFTYLGKLHSYNGIDFSNHEISANFSTDYNSQGTNYCLYRDEIAFFNRSDYQLTIFTVEGSTISEQATLDNLGSYNKSFGLSQVANGLIFSYNSNGSDKGIYNWNSATNTLSILKVEGVAYPFSRVVNLSNDISIASVGGYGIYSFDGTPEGTVLLTDKTPCLYQGASWHTLALDEKIVFNVESSSSFGDDHYYITDGSATGTSPLITPESSFPTSIINVDHDVYAAVGVSNGYSPEFYAANIDTKESELLFASEERSLVTPAIINLGIVDNKWYFASGLDRTIGREIYSIPLVIKDDDNDGFDTTVDCDDTSASINPGATEILDNDIDENCDGIKEYSDIDGDGFDTTVDCDDNDPSINPGTTEIANNNIDEDCDGITLIIDNDNDGYNSADDCDDNDPNSNPGADEIPNNEIDENCDGNVLIVDNDQDGYNSDIDCDDNNASAYPDAEEIPNNDIDENCDGIVLTIDNDNDGYNSDQDCDDNDASINPGATEIFNNNIDEDCDGSTVPADVDQDGYTSDIDCDDNDPTAHPDTDEIPNNDVDENCDGVILVIDNDGDGYNSDDDCDDNDPAINPAATEIPNNDIDENCDGSTLTIDDDQDGYTSDIDCDDNDPSAYPDADEIPNNDIDENCDGVILVIDNDGDGYNSDDDCDDNDPAINPAATEIPNNDIDENCDGSTLTIDDDQDGYTSDIDCDDNDPSAYPDADEIPNNDIDENCDGVILVIDNDGDGYNSDDDCDDNDPSINPMAEDIAENGIDEDCDGQDFILNGISIGRFTIQAYPNPSSEFLNIDIFGEGELQLRVYRPTGLRSVNQAISGSNRIDISQWPQGIHIVEVLDLASRKRAYIRFMKLG